MASVPSTRNQQLCDISPRATSTAGNARTVGTWLLHGWQRALGSCGCHVPLAAMNLLPLLVLLAACWPAHGWDNCGFQLSGRQEPEQPVREHPGLCQVDEEGVL
ncbi:hypothetical protein AV530_009535 [Patagioenas fasciata monilis]|uniref:Uncharacterized protein n=1 Tax=Patagioenas fasciata monilis TaxID=372326 RepID=A0A1V4JKA1_PATFA|nr:hypothetical protein AV530_009535 [Patagioenas fasciata monilis]